MLHTEQFISDLINDAELNGVLSNVPECFIQQARDGASQFYIDTELFSRSQYMREDGSCDLLRLVLENPVAYDDGTVSVIVRVTGILNPDGSLEPHKTGAQLTPGQMRIPGFRSTPVVFSPESITDGVISEGDFKALHDYAALWEEVTEEYGDNALYTKEHANKRLWAVAVNEEGLVTFEMALRQNPRTKDYVVGIQNVSFSNCKFIGAGTASAQRARAATGVTFGKTSVKIPDVARGAAAGDIKTKRRARR